MMTKTTLSDGRRTRPRFAAPTPTPPKFLIETPRLEIAVSGRKTSKMQNPNRDKMGVFYPPQRLNGLQWHRPARRGGHSCLPRGTKGLCASAAPGIPRLPHTAASLSLKILIANLELEFGLTHTKLSPLRISNRKYFAVFHSHLLHRREKSGRPTTSDRVVVATRVL